MEAIAELHTELAARVLIARYFTVNSRPVQLDALRALVSDDVVVVYPSGRFYGAPAYMAHQAKTARVLRFCCGSSVVGAAGPIEFGATFAEPPPAGCALRAAVPWGYVARPWLLCGCPLRQRGVNRYGFKVVKGPAGEEEVRICYVQTAPE